MRRKKFDPLSNGRGGRKLKRSIYILPSVFTVGNIFAGFIALIATLSGQYQQAAIAIGVAVVLDGLDGRVARLAKVTSDFGVHLDSLADTISPYRSGWPIKIWTSVSIR